MRRLPARAPVSDDGLALVFEFSDCFRKLPELRVDERLQAAGGRPVGARATRGLIVEFARVSLDCTLGLRPDPLDDDEPRALGHDPFCLVARVVRSDEKPSGNPAGIVVVGGADAERLPAAGPRAFAD